MRVSPRLLAGILVCFASCSLPSLADTQSDEAAASRIIGPQWKQLSRRAGMIFAGTVLNAATAPGRTDRPAGPARSDPGRPDLDRSGMRSLATDQPDPSTAILELNFRVDRPIAGVASGQILTILEWIGASSRQRPMRSGERILIFLYAPSRLGLTSPVGGSLGQVALDATGTNVIERDRGDRHAAQRAERAIKPATSTTATIPLVQLERAIRAARGE